MRKNELSASQKILLLLMVISMMLRVGEASAGSFYGKVVTDLLKNNHFLKAKASSIKIAEAEYGSALSQFFPDISISTQTEKYTPLSTESNSIGIYGLLNNQTNRAEWRSSFRLNVEYKVSSLYKNIFDARYYRRMLDAADFGYREEAKRLIRAMSDVCEELFTSYLTQKYETDILFKMQELFALEQKALIGGEISHADLLELSLQIKEKRLAIIAAKKNLRQNMDRLNEYTGGNYTESALTLPLVRNETVSTLSAGDDDWVATNPSYRRKELEMAAITERKNFVTASLLPDISIFYRREHYGSDASNIGAGLRNVEPYSENVGCIISLPLFNGGRTYHERKRAIAELERQENEFKAQKISLLKDMETLLGDYDTLVSFLRVNEEIVSHRKELLGIYMRSQSLGYKSKKDLLSTEIKLLTGLKDLEVTRVSITLLAQKIFLEKDYESFMRENYGDGTNQR